MLRTKFGSLVVNVANVEFVFRVNFDFGHWLEFGGIEGE